MNAGIVTATTFFGDGSNLTGAGSTAYIRQSVSAAQTGTTNINLNDGNIIYYDPLYDINTLTFSNVKTADDISIIRSLDFATSLSSGGVDFDGTGDYLTVPNSSDFSFGTGDFTIEMWVYFDALAVSGPGLFQLSGSAGPSNVNYMTVRGQSFDQTGWDIIIKGNTSTSPETWQINQSGEISTGDWYHVALERKSSKTSLYVNGTALSMKLNNSGTAYTEIADTTDYDFTYLNISGYYDTSFLLNGKISNFRVVKGTAVYGGNFQRPRAELTNITNTKLLCCLSSSSTTAATVIPTGSITASGDPTATSVSLNSWSTPSITWPTSITWNGGSAPTLTSANSYSLTGQVFNLVTADGGTTWYGYEEVNNNNEAPNEAGQLFIWGANQIGQQGNSTRSTNTDNGISSPVQVPGTTWDTVSGSYSVYARKNDGTLWVWGRNTIGQLGLNNTTQYSSPVQIPGTTWSDNFSSMFSIVVATKTDGTLWAWGHNNQGQLGLNHDDERSSPTQIPGTTWSTKNNKIKAGYQSMFAIKTDGTMWSWGYAGQGQLGQNQSPAPGSSVEKISSPAQIGAKTNWRILGGTTYSGSSAINTDGELWTWGANSDGHLGVNDTTQRSSPVQVPGTTWNKLMGGHSLYYVGAGIKTDGTLWVWGKNNKGQLGQNSVIYRSSPVQIPGTTWDTVVGGQDCVGATKTDGTAWVWGNNSLGKLGLNQANTLNISSPTQIPGTAWTQLGMGGSGNNAISFGIKT